MTGATLIQNADWVVEWDDIAKCHTYRRNGDVLIADDKIVKVADSVPISGSEPKEIVDGRGYMVMPGLINVHAHPSTEPAFRGVREDHGCLEHHMASLYERFQAFRLSDIGRVAALEIAYAELLRSGVTAVCDQTFPIPGWQDVMRRSGMRVFVAPGYASARWVIKSKTEIGYSWSENDGRRMLDGAIRIIDQLDADPSGRLTGVIYPAQVDTCSEELLRDSVALAKERNLPITTHCSQAVIEFQEMVRRHGKSPIQWLHEIGFLGPNAILGHAIFVDDHSSIRWHTHRDIDLLAETQTTVAHCPTPFARYGEALEDIGTYHSRGVNLGIGTDVAPHNIIEEMRLASILGRVKTRDIRAANTGMIFDATTIGGARALGRDDIGRLMAGAKADLVMVDLNHPSMIPPRDPLRALIYSAADRAIKRVYVDGRAALID